MEAVLGFYVGFFVSFWLLIASLVCRVQGIRRAVTLTAAGLLLAVIVRAL